MRLSKNDERRITDFYLEALNEYGPFDHRSVHWTEQEGQIKRFEILADVGDLNCKSVLDVGCGVGAFYGFLRQKNIEVKYFGIDIIPEFIEEARKIFSGKDRSESSAATSPIFEHKDIFDISGQYDFVVASGALSFKVENNDNYYKAMVKKMYGVAKKGVAFNMLNIDGHIDDSIYAAYSPAEVSDFCKTFCDDVSIVIGYLPQDFTIYMY